MKKSAFVTGGTRGIGKAITKKLLQEGYFVIVNYAHSSEDVELLKSEIPSEFSDSYEFIQFDNTRLDQIPYLIEQLEEMVSGLDVVVFNAGSTYKGELGKLDIDKWKNLFDIHVHFPTFFMNNCLSFLNKDVRIVFISSLMAIHPHGTSLAYGVSKKAVHGLTENLVKHLQPIKGRVNAIAPGFVETEWHKNKTKELLESIKSKIALNSFSNPEDIAQLCFSIIENNYLNGSIIKIDGGYSYK